MPACRRSERRFGGNTRNYRRFDKCRDGGRIPRTGLTASRQNSRRASRHGSRLVKRRVSIARDTGSASPHSLSDLSLRSPIKRRDRRLPSP